MITIFNDNTDNENFHKNGFVIKDVSENKIDELSKIYNIIKPSFFWNTMYFNLLKQNKKNIIVDKEIRDLFSSFYEDTFNNYTDDLGCFVTKRFKNKWDLGWHQDWTMTDEDVAPALLCWIPLQDTNEKNGGLTVLEGTHNAFSNTIRSFYMPSIYISVYEKEFIPFQKKIELQKGQIFIFSHSLFHGSFINNTWQNRVTAMTSIFPKNIPKIYHYRDKDDIYTLKINKEFHFKHQPALDKYDLRQFYETLEVKNINNVRFARKEEVLKYLGNRSI